MATAGPAPKLASNGTGGLDNFVNVLGLLKGSSTTTTNNVSQAGINEIVASVLRGNQGLATVAGGQKSAGVYNSTVNTQMINDLVASAAAKGEAARSSQTIKTPGLLTPQTLLALGGGMAAQKLLGPAAKKLMAPLEGAGDKIASAIFGDGLKPVGGALESSGELAAMSNAASVGGTVDGFATGAGLDGFLTAGFADAGIAGFGGAALSADVGLGGLGSFAAETGVADALGAFGGIELGGAAAAGSGAAAGAAAAAEGGGAFEALTALVLWIVCTELHRQGRMNSRHYYWGAKEFAKYDERGKRGYYIWAVPSVKHLRKYPNSMYSKLLEKVFCARAEYLAAKAGCKGARKTLFGAVTTHGLYAFCWILSRTIARSAEYDYVPGKLA